MSQSESNERLQGLPDVPPACPHDQHAALDASRACIEFAPVCIAMVDRDMRYITYSRKWLHEHGQGLSSLVGLNHLDLYPQMPDELACQYRNALAGLAVVNDEFLWNFGNGHYRWMKCTVQAWHAADGSIGGLVITREDITDRKNTESDLNSLMEESRDAIWISTRTGEFLYINPVTPALTGFSVDELGTMRFKDLIHEEREDELEEYLALTQYAKFTRREWKLNHKNGGKIDVELTTGHLPDGRMVAISRDLTDKMQAEAERNKLFQAVEQSTGSVMITNRDAEIEYVNPAFLARTGYSRDEIFGAHPRILNSPENPSSVYTEMAETIARGQIWRGEIINVSKSGDEFIQYTTVSPIRESDGVVRNYIAIGEDITSRKKGEKRIYELAYFDQLTGLPNRTLLLERLSQVIAQSANSGNHGALLFIDLDHFKNINDTLGHQKGDLVLQQVADSVTSRLRDGDTVARFGGDEFVVLLSNLGTDAESAAANAYSAASKLLDSLNQTFRLDEVVHHNTASIGVAMINGASAQTDELLKQADMAMYKAKKAGRNTVCFFDPSMELAMKQQASMEEDLRIALRERQFVLQYQGQFQSKSSMTGAEVLVRWKHPEKGMMSPALFIPFAEESGQILAIGNWVLDTACRELAAWRNNPDLCELELAVNVSPLQFRQLDFVETVLATLHRTGADPARLKLELTESMLIENIDDIVHKMLALKAHGIGFSLDDFGTGFSSLSLLKRLPLDQLKIDQSFIRDVHSDPNGAAIATTIVSLGKNLGLTVIAEGVETDEQREFLAQAGCYAYQGYLFSRPLALESFTDLAVRLSHHRTAA